jgi:murein DD-endopeptidase MepM/ murein hydrolase activator NlpD
MNFIKNGRAMLCGLLAAVLVLSMMPVSAEAAKSSSEIREQIKDMKQENEELKEELKGLRDQYKANENEILDMVNRKNLIDQEIAILTEQIRNINTQITSYGLLIADKQDELDEAQAKLTELSQKHKARIQAMEEEGALSYWEVLFKANSFSDLLDRLNMIQEIAASDKRRMQELSAAAERVSSTQTDLANEKEELEGTRVELDAAQVELSEKRAEADELLRQLIEKGEEFQALIDESEDLQHQLMADIAQAEKDLKEAEYKEWLATYVPPTTRPGNDTKPSPQIPSSSGWVCPVPYYTLTSPFGMRVHPISGKWKMHDGVDLALPQGEPIYAAKSGKVTTASYQAGGAGYYVSINHGDGFSSIYMHMTHFIVSPGQYVTAGQVIGYVGSTGGSTGPHLHFGISYNGTYVNPMDYI